MTPEEFCYWLQGWYEINGTANAQTAEQSKIIQQHLQLVFTKVSKKFTIEHVQMGIPLGFNKNEDLFCVNNPVLDPNFDNQVEEPLLLSNFGHNASC